jgi:LVIVD repeat
VSAPALVATFAAAVALGGGGTRSSTDGRAAGPAPVAQHHDHKHAGSSGHLAATASNVVRVSSLSLKSEGKMIADVGVLNGYAYLGQWGGVCARNGVHVVDIRDPARPRKVAFVAAPSGGVPGEGVQALHVQTRRFDGDLLVTNNESCDRARRFGGLNLYDVSNPRKPKTLVEGFGDRTMPNESPGTTAHEIHSVFAWDAGTRAYAVLVDNLEARNVDIVDITNPSKPFLVAEYSLRDEFPQIAQSSPPNLVDVFHHDVVVKKIGRRQVMLVSYWDGGYVKLDVTDPRKARYLADSDFGSPDVELLAQAGLSESPEGNAHQSEFTKANTHIIAADEDFGPSQISAATDDGQAFHVRPGDRARALVPGDRLTGPTRYVGRACEGDALVPPAEGATFAVVVRGVCEFTPKLAKIEASGYAAALVVNGEGADGCGGFRMAVQSGIPAFSVDRPTGFALFDRRYSDEVCRTGSSDVLPQVQVGALGDRVTIRSFFDGWGYVHLFRNGGGKLRQVDTYAIAEAMDPAFASGRGDLTVHEVATSHVRNDLAYLSYYAGGLRVVRIQRDRLVEAGSFVDVNGNNFWGVQVFRHRGREYVAASDIDFGLYVFRYTGP